MASTESRLQLSTPLSSAYWIGIVQGAKAGAWEGFHWQLQLCAEQGTKRRAFGSSPGNDYFVEESDPYPFRHAMCDGKMVMFANVIYGARLTPSQYAAAEAILEERYTGDTLSHWHPLMNSCRTASVAAYATILREVGVRAPEAAVNRVSWLRRHMLSFRTQWDAGEYRLASMATLAALFNFLPGVSGGSVDLGDADPTL